jgi:hypothetical protein
MDSELFYLLLKVFAFMIFFVGGYVFMFLNVMRTDPKEIKFREEQGLSSGLVPSRKKI